MKGNKGQAILEVALFGSIILMLLGITLDYGMRYGFKQRADMLAFRRALRASGDPTQSGHGSYMLVQDRHIPNPGNPTGAAIGSVQPFFASHSVVRDYRMNETPDTQEQLPYTTIRIEGNATSSWQSPGQPNPLRTAGFLTIPITRATSLS